MAAPMIALDVNSTTREVFGNIAPWMQVVFFVMIATSLGLLGWQVLAHLRQWRKGRPGGFERDWRVWIERLSVYALAQKRVHKKSLGALLHLLLFSGFLVLTIGTTLLGIADDGPYYFHHGWYYLDLRADDGRVRSRLLSWLPPGNVPARLPPTRQPRPQLARLVAS